MRDTIFKEIELELKNNSELVILTADLGFGIFEKFEKKYPSQFINVGVAEQNLIGIGSGLASEGLRVIVYSIANFPIFRCLEQIRNDAAYHKINMTIISCGAGFTYGQLGFSHHLTEDIAVMSAIPNISIFSPSTKNETISIFRQVIKKKGVSYIRIDKRAIKVDQENTLIKINRPNILQKGKKILFIGTGTILEEAIAASKLIKQKYKFDSTILSLNSFSIKSYKSLLKFISSHEIIFTIEEHNLNGGLGSLINNELMKYKIYPKHLINFGIKNKFCSKIGNQKYLRKINNIDSLSIYKQIIKLL